MVIVRKLIASDNSQSKETMAVSCLLPFLLLLLVSCLSFTTGMAATPSLLKEITVVSDDNYPPFIFRDEKGHLQGILVDKWGLWEEKTGIKVDLLGMDWDKAKKTMAEGNAQVIDTIFFTEERAKTLAFSAPYASLDVPIFFHETISGIRDVRSLHGFTIGVKAGDASIDFFKKHGIHTLREYPSYESIVRDAADEKIKVFSIDAPPAHYYLYKMGIERQYRHTAPMYTGQFHRAVHKEREDILKAVEEGFAKISRKEHEEIEKRWLGSPISMSSYWTYLLYSMGALAVPGAGLLLWNYSLRRRVSQKTLQLQEAVEKLEKSEDNYRNLFENASEAIFVAEDGRLSFLNPITTMMTGYSSEELTTKPFIEFIHPDDRDMVFDKYMKLLKGEEISNPCSFRIVHREGNIIWVELNAVLIDWNSNPATLNFMSDITERKQAEVVRREMEARLQRSEKMEALGTMAGGVAHDLNNVLGVLVGYSELLAEKLPEGSPLRRYADSIHKSGIRGAAIIQDLLDLARRGIAVSEVVDLNGVVFDYLRTPEFENLKHHHPHVNIRTELAEGLLNIKGSPVHLGKAVMNLASNATEAISGLGEVTIRTENRYLDHPVRGYDDMQEGDYVVLTVSDTGSGISADDLGKIFEPFYTKKVMGRSGTGLGLAIVWGTVVDHNGYIDVQSEEGKGSAFSLYFPATREDKAKPEKAISPISYMGGGESILVVDDVKEQRELAACMLDRLGYRVAAAASGEEAIVYLKSREADLIVLDMIMDPGMDGMETYRSILEIRPKQKAIIASGYSETDRVRQTQKMGAGAFVRKPYVLEKIGLAVRNELDRE